MILIGEISTFLFGSWKGKLFSLWLLISLGVWIFLGDNSTIFSAFGVLISGFSTIIFWILRKPISGIVNALRISSKKKFIVIGSLGAVWVEFEFWLLEEISGVSGIAASPDLFLDLLFTMPWYIIMVFLLWKVETKYSYTLYTILMFGGIYDFFADGIFGTVMGTGGLPLEVLILLLITFPAFVLSYSFIVLPPSYLLQEDINRARTELKNGWSKYLYGLLPLIGFLIYGIIVVILF